MRIVIDTTLVMGRARTIALRYRRPAVLFFVTSVVIAIVTQVLGERSFLLSFLDSKNAERIARASDLIGLAVWLVAGISFLMVLGGWRRGDRGNEKVHTGSVTEVKPTDVVTISGIGPAVLINVPYPIEQHGRIVTVAATVKIGSTSEPIERLEAWTFFIKNTGMSDLVNLPLRFTVVDLSEKRSIQDPLSRFRFARLSRFNGSETVVKEPLDNSEVHFEWPLLKVSEQLYAEMWVTCPSSGAHSASKRKTQVRVEARAPKLTVVYRDAELDPSTSLFKLRSIVDND